MTRQDKHEKIKNKIIIEDKKDQKEDNNNDQKNISNDDTNKVLIDKVKESKELKNSNEIKKCLQSKHKGKQRRYRYQDSKR